ncbi:MAG: DinB family protein [Bacillaceae bacterium]
MNEIELIVLNFQEVRRRSIKVWKAIPNDFLHWKPDDEAFTCAEMIRHVLASEYNYHQIIQNCGSVQNLHTPFSTREFTTVEKELEFALTYREIFINFIKSLTRDDLVKIKIDRSDLSDKGFTGYIRTLDDFLLRIAYHEAVHTGQLLDYMRKMEVERPDIWD